MFLSQIRISYYMVGISLLLITKPFFVKLNYLSTNKLTRKEVTLLNLAHRQLLVILSLNLDLFFNYKTIIFISAFQHFITTYIIRITKLSAMANRISYSYRFEKFEIR